MAFEEVEKGPEEIGRYWNPDQVGDTIEGNIYKFTNDDYNNKRIDLYLGQDEDDEAILTMLPAHADLKRVYVNLERGDYIRVELIKLIPPKKENGYPKRIYKVMKDPERKVEWPDDDSDYEVETVTDDYYAE